MKISEKEFGVIYFKRKSNKYNNLSLIFKYIKLWSPAFIFLWFLIKSYPIVISIILGIALFSWLAEVKTKSLRNINQIASDELKK